ncbi:hypothetical protein BDK51DRAFT_38121, partial [Blyttiomyces helicus]
MTDSTLPPRPRLLLPGSSASLLDPANTLSGGCSRLQGGEIHVIHSYACHGGYGRILNLSASFQRGNASIIAKLTRDILSTTEHHDQINFELDLDPLSSPTLTLPLPFPASAGFDFMCDDHEYSLDAPAGNDDQTQLAFDPACFDPTNVDFSSLLDEAQAYLPLFTSMPTVDGERESVMPDDVSAIRAEDANAGEDTAAAAARDLDELFGGCPIIGGSESSYAALDGTVEIDAEWAQQLESW